MSIEYCNNGVTRLVLLVGNWAIKIPNHEFQHNHFLLGCYANWMERYYTKSWEGYPPLGDKIAPTIFCSWFGILSVQKRVTPLNRRLTEKEIEAFKDITTDIKEHNFGWYKNKLVCVDYGQTTI